MFDLFAVLKQFFVIKFDTPCIDNWVFQLHYRATTIILTVATILVTATTYFGESIQCYASDNYNLNRVITNYCYFSSTYTLPKKSENKYYEPHPGVRAFEEHEHIQPQIRKHTYYQWVPFMLFGQAIMFYLTHLLWKKCERGRIRIIKTYLENASFASVCDKNCVLDGKTIYSKDKLNKNMAHVRSAFMEHIILNQSWSKWLTFYEIANLLNAMLQFYLNDLFLLREFHFFGSNVIEHGYSYVDNLFPKVTKCDFYKYGSSGFIQKFDAMCILALNNIIEKVYLFLWFWLIIVIAASAVALLWRLFTICFYSSSTLVNKIVFSNFKFVNKNTLTYWDIKLIRKYFSYNDWLFLAYMANNIDGLVFRKLLLQICEDIVDKKPFIHDIHRL